jgi:Fe2+ or Zn2+ uptake regulation protein
MTPTARRGRRAPVRPARVVASPTVSVPAPSVVRVDLLEDPHAHVVCRSCGRIQSIDLTELDLHLLTELAARHPDGWSVDGVTFSLTGACQRCREGPSVKR